MSGDRPSGVVDDTSAMTDWETSIARSGYRVRLTDGKWHDVPNFALIDPKTNKLGYAVVWVLPPTSLSIRCFLPGAGAENVGPFAECSLGHKVRVQYPGREDSLFVQPTPRPGGPGHRLPPADRDRSALC